MIVAAAIRDMGGKVYALPAPARHHDIIRHIVENSVVDRVPAKWDQGFIDSDLGFVGRVQARDIAVHVDKQIDYASHPSQLFSEDLW